MELPKEIIKAKTSSPQSLFVYSAPKAGKTTLGALLKDSLLIDLENGSNFVDAVKVQVNSIEEIRELCEEVKKQGKPYRYGILDTTTKLEEMVIPLANTLYKSTPMGANFKGDNVLTLPNGAGK